MTTAELYASLNTQQTAALNALLIEQRETLNAAHVTTLAGAVANDQTQLAELAQLRLELINAPEQIAEIARLRQGVALAKEAIQALTKESQIQFAEINRLTALIPPAPAPVP